MENSITFANHKVFLILVLGGFFLAVAARTFGGYPNCWSDEHNWLFISHQVARGVDWPISGPLHFGFVQIIASANGLAHDRAMGLTGLFSVPILLLIMGYAYHRLGVSRPGSVLVALSSSTYFLAPLLESRPQQWGQVLVMLGVTLGWRAIHGLGAWWPYVLVLIVTACVHILSFAILMACSLVLWVMLYVLQRSTLTVVVRLALCLLAGLVIFLVPGGPYASMIADLQLSQFHVPQRWGSLAVGLGLLVTPLVFGLMLLRRHAQSMLTAALAALDRRPAVILSVFGLLAVATLVLQAAMLPAEAWTPYRGSILLFGLSQSGNLFFVGLLIYGLLAARQTYKQGRDQALIQTHVILLLSMGVITIAALVLSFWMLHTNWLLRVLNYGTLFMAPFAAIGLSQIKNRLEKWALLLLMMTISLVSVVRPPGLFNC